MCATRMLIRCLLVVSVSVPLIRYSFMTCSPSGRRASTARTSCGSENARTDSHMTPAIRDHGTVKHEHAHAAGRGNGPRKYETGRRAVPSPKIPPPLSDRFRFSRQEVNEAAGAKRTLSPLGLPKPCPRFREGGAVVWPSALRSGTAPFG
ncbi:hypothetical protein ANANG_G00199700 [Anguilla anguilla]|uniref:Secreted protein n=1 Tax=Anguilla anguilla TaxID=7936 RepID=A0A9D3M2P0_ANGAN|nr:hypothetical protein ANANG_G00199700 [Anguilla anguilla]